MTRAGGFKSLTWLTPALCLLLAAAATSQEGSDAPSFPSEAAAITVDVVVLDDDGQPVRGLTRADFAVREDGREQTIVGFEARDVEVPRETTEGSTPAAVSQVTTSNEGPAAAPGRVFALLIDDLGISPPVATQLKPALADWMRDRADDRDEITIVTTSGELWWSDVLDRGRADLLTVLDRFEGRRLEDPQRTGGMSEWEAYRILFAEEGMSAQRADTADGPTSGGGVPTNGGIRFLGSTAIERVAQRFYDGGLCHCVPGDCNVPRCFGLVRAAANAVHETWRRRAESVYSTIQRLSKSLEGVRGRKSILLVSEDFIQDSSVDRPFRDAIDASQKANTAIYFLGARGLTGNSAFSVAQGGAEGSLTRQAVPTRQRDIGMRAFEESVLATGGAETLADATGGALTVSNDLAAGLERMALDSTAYYLLGYQPESPPDGRWHDLQVEVARPGVRLLARQGYVASRPGGLAREQEERASDHDGNDGEEKRSQRPLAPTLLAGHSRDGLPLRLAAYVRDNDGVGKARVQVVVEIDNSRVRIDRVPTPWRSTLDFTIMAAGLDRGALIPVDERLHMSLNHGEVANGWWLVPRDVWLPPGVTQLRVLVRDVLSGGSGLATLRIVVPDVTEPYLSTPLLTNRALPASKPGEPPQLVPTAHRRFAGSRPLHCRYEVFTFGGETLRGVPQLLGSYLLQGPDGLVVSADQPTLIETDARRAVRRIVLPVEGLDDGRYVLAINVEDRLARHTLTTRVPFVIERGEEPRPAPPR